MSVIIKNPLMIGGGSGETIDTTEKTVTISKPGYSFYYAVDDQVDGYSKLTANFNITTCDPLIRRGDEGMLYAKIDGTNYKILVNVSPFVGSILSYNLNSGCRAIAPWALQNHQNITTASIRVGVTEIGRYAFHACPKLTQVELPSSLESIGESCFANCTALDTLSYNGTSTMWQENITFGTNWHANIPATSVFCVGDRVYVPLS